MPLNFPNDTVGTSAVMKDRLRAGASSADVDPMEIDTSVSDTFPHFFQRIVITNAIFFCVCTC